MEFLIGLALVACICFAVTVVIQLIVAVVGGPEPDLTPLRQLAHIGRAKLAVAKIDREYEELLVRR